MYQRMRHGVRLPSPSTIVGSPRPSDLVDEQEEQRPPATTITNTMPVVIIVSLRVGQVTLATSCRTSRTNSAGEVFAISDRISLVSPRIRSPHQSISNIGPSLAAWQEWRGSNPQPPVLETGALPVELHSYDARPPDDCSYMVATVSLHH